MAKKASNPKVRCIECRHAELMQWDNNPVISKCPHALYRQVANSLRSCSFYERRMRPPTIKNFTHHVT